MKTQDTTLQRHPGAVPTTQIIWPTDRHRGNQIQQTKGSAKPLSTNVRPSVQPSKSTVPPRTTPQPVSRVRVVTKTVDGQKQVTVQFAHPGNDPYFAGAGVYLRRAGQQPVLVASGAQSPLTFTVDATAVPHSIHITSIGNWGESPLSTAPSRPVSLR